MDDRNCGFCPACAVGKYAQCANEDNEKDQLRAEVARLTADRDAATNKLNACFGGTKRDLATKLLQQCDKSERLSKERDALQEQVKTLRDAMYKLACLGNGECFGNSIGNDIAKEALSATEPKETP